MLVKDCTMDIMAPENDSDSEMMITTPHVKHYKGLVAF